MKRSFAAVSALAGMLSLASAADLPLQKKLIAAPVPSPNWTGFYAGLNAGGAWSNSSSTSVTTYPGFINYPNLSVSGTTYSPAAAWMASGTLASGYSGFIGGGQIGYNWRFYQSLVVGAEADIQGIAGSGSPTGAYQIAPRANVDDQIGYTVFGIISTSRNISYLGTIRGKIGYLAAPNFLVYGTGGLAYGGVKSNISISGAALPGTGGSPFNTSGSNSENRIGWAVSGGAEWMFLKDWSAKAEYLYYDLGNLSYIPSPMVSFKARGGVNFINLSRAQTRFNGSVVRIGINFHFNSALIPVIAKF